MTLAAPASMCLGTADKSGCQWHVLKMGEASAAFPQALMADGRHLARSGWVQPELPEGPKGTTAPTNPNPAHGCNLGFLGAKLVLPALRKKN